MTTTRHVLLLSVFATAFTAAACGDGTPSTTSGQLTYWHDAAPVYNAKCVRCHQEGGIAPFRLDNYADAKSHAPLELGRINAGTMPPYFLVHDGSCGEFHDEDTLTPAEKTTLTTWLQGDMLEGTPAPLTLPPQPKLNDAVDLSTPNYAPVAQGGQLAEFDDYRCFVMDAPVTSDSYLTGYAVTPGEASIVHHVIAFVVDPQALGEDGRTNAEIMQALDADSPDRLGWPCFGGAGDHVNVNGLPVTWAPGQGIVSYPDGMGVPVRATDKVVIQMHYNLADPASVGKTDRTTVNLRFAPTVNRQLAFLLPDPFLQSLANDPPDSLPPGKADYPYTWTLTGADVGVTGPISSVDLVAVMPHMHGRGVRQLVRLGEPGNLGCAAHLENWSFHWQEFYTYKTMPKITPTTQIEVTCDYNTSADTMPVLPGWGTRNEMCLAVLMVALPPS